MLSEIILAGLVELTLQRGGARGAAWLRSKAAQRELASIAAECMELAATRVPGLETDLTSERFARLVVAPTLRTMVADPSQLPDADRLAAQAINMFVERYGADKGLDGALADVFRTNRAEVTDAFSTFLTELRSGLYRSKHWGDLAHVIAGEATLRGLVELQSSIEDIQREKDVAAIDIDGARLDAKSGSDELRSWPRAILDHELQRPELDRLRSRIADFPSATTLLTGVAGSGKSALLARLTQDLEDSGYTVFGIKADTLPSTIATFGDVARSLGMAGELLPELSALAGREPVVLIIDQLDAVSDVMDQSSQRMKVLLRLVQQIRQNELPVHVLVSSRPFEAAHDARFQHLKADGFSLELPSAESVQNFLAGLGIEWGDVSGQLWQTLRRPFALKLFVDLIQRGVPASSVDSGSLLDSWLNTANLGSDAQRQDVFELADRLAAEMLETETLWRPLDSLQARHKNALARAEACGLLVRIKDRVGFCHQSWLDDFQAKSFRAGKDLAEFVWQSQDSLFARATVLRSLERLQRNEPRAYRDAVSTLLWDDRTRRHIKHLLVDVIAATASPNQQDVAWLETLVQRDGVLANRYLWQVAKQWSVWRAALRDSLPTLMCKQECHWRTSKVLAAEAKEEPEHVLDLIRRHWNTVEHDRLVFDVLENAGVMTAGFERLVGEILARSAVDRYAVSHLVDTLRKTRRYAEACRLVGLWFDAQETDSKKPPSLHNVDDLAVEAPREFAEVFLPRFLSDAKREVGQSAAGYKRYPRSRSLRWGWHADSDQVLRAFPRALNALATEDPEHAMTLIRQLERVEIDEVQDVAGQAYIAGAASLAEQALAFLMADDRRLQIGDAHVSIEPGSMSLESGLTSQELVAAISPHLADDAAKGLRDFIESWSLYGEDFVEGEDPKTRLERRKWINEDRMELLERLPDRFLSPRRKRQINEWRAAKRMPIPTRNREPHLATIVGSPMSAAQMGSASDKDIIRILNEITDQTNGRTRQRPISIDGGITQLSRAFGAFAKEHPERAVALCEQHFVADRHEHAAAQMVDELAQVETFPAERLLGLIHQLSERGFSSQTWRTYASWALGKLAGRLAGLPDSAITLLESWLERDPSVIAERIQSRLTNEDVYEQRNADREVPTNPVVFSAYGSGRLQIVPQNNYSMLRAIFQGLLNRENPSHGQWLGVLERHAGYPEDPHIWSYLLLEQGRWFWGADHERVGRLLVRLWERDRRIFLNTDLGGVLWVIRRLLPDDLMIAILKAWSADENEETQQAAAELIQAFALVVPDARPVSELADLFTDRPSPTLTGRLFTAASAWREGDSELRSKAHLVLMEFVEHAEGDQAHAISSAVDRTETLPPDDLTRELLLKIAGNEVVLEACLNGRLADALQSLLLYPDFEEPVLLIAEKVAAFLAREGRRTNPAYVDEDFVQIVIGLQRNSTQLRARAMDAYELLLDAGAYGAEQAADDVLER